MGNLYLELAILEPISEIEKKVNREASVISNHYSRFIKDIKIKNLDKIAIMLIKGSNENILPPLSLIRVCVFEKSYDIYSLCLKEEKELKKELLEIIHTSILLLCKKFEWSIEPFEKAYLMVKEKEYNNSYLAWGGKNFESKNKGKKVSINIQMNSSNIILSALVFDELNKHTKKIELARLYPLDLFLNQIINKVTWINESQFKLSGARGEINFIVSLLNGNVELQLNPKIRTLDQLENEIKNMKLVVTGSLLEIP